MKRDARKAFNRSRMSRKQFLRRSGAAVAGAAALSMSGAAHAADYTVIDVYPSGSHPYVGVPGLFDAIADVADAGTVKVHHGTYNIEAEQMVLSKSINLVGVPNASGEKPEILGSNCTSIPNGGGMIAIDAPGKNVVIRDLYIHHIDCSVYQGEPNYPVGTVVNYDSALFHLDICDVDTAASTACITMELNGNAPPGRQVKVTGCRITGTESSLLSCVNIGSFTPILPNLKGGLLEVSDCVLESGSFIGVAAFGFDSDSDTRVLVEGNEIGLINEKHAVGITVGTFAPTKCGPLQCLGFAAVRGDIRVINNSIRISTYLYTQLPPPFPPIPVPYYASGIVTMVEADANNAAHTLIADNDIEMSVVDDQQALFYHGAILHFDYTPETFASNTSADITGNTITSNPEDLSGRISPKFGIEAGSFDPAFTPVPGNIINARISNNDLKGMEATINQLRLPAGSSGNEVKNNDWGYAQVAGISVSGYNNSFVNDNFWGPYLGKNQENPCIWLEEGTYGNVITALKKGKALQGFDLCNQILDEEPEDNIIRGYKKCQSIPSHVLLAMLKRQCEKDGGTWDGNACSYPEYEGLYIGLG